ncbi:hypothetical protein A4X13_0g8305 [Tilletia indica]|uniref:Uncharacterized protein n=1 Tax=Tilletia indica TaxID=43049 RepID=A0A8T8SFM7_9BASI|nr:hypothetical protein A4X13_0g8305 [Tilletia indica]
MPKLSLSPQALISMILQGYEKAGAQILQFRCHDRLLIAGNHHMVYHIQCLVNSKDTSKPLASCAFPAPVKASCNSPLGAASYSDLVRRTPSG